MTGGLEDRDRKAQHDPGADGVAVAQAQTTLHVRRAAEGDAGSAGWLIERFAPLLLAQARYRLGSRLVRFVEAEDLVQDVWVRALPKLAGLAPRDGRLTPVVVKFLSVTLLRRVKDLLHKHVLGKPLATDGADRGHGGDDSMGGSAGADLVADRTGIVTMAMRREHAGELSAAIAALDEKDRAIVVLRAIEQRGNAEAAALLELEPSAASARYRRALEKLRHLLPPDLVEAAPAGH